MRDLEKTKEQLIRELEELRLKLSESSEANHDSLTGVPNRAMLYDRLLKIRVIAEGVETVEQLELLRSLGCDEVQGFLFSKPLGSEEIAKQLIEQPFTRIFESELASGHSEAK